MHLWAHFCSYSSLTFRILVCQSTIGNYSTPDNQPQVSSGQFRFVIGNETILNGECCDYSTTCANIKTESIEGMWRKEEKKKSDVELVANNVCEMARDSFERVKNKPKKNLRNCKKNNFVFIATMKRCWLCHRENEMIQKVGKLSS